MKKIISEIHNAIQNSRTTVAFLQEKTQRIWIDNYPIALLHEAHRVGDTQTLARLQENDFFNTKGFSKERYTLQEINALQEKTPNAIKSAYLIALKTKPQEFYSFKAKHPHDKWKKIQDDGNFEAFVASSKFDETQSHQEIESKLRDILRSSKEIAALKACGFVWIVSLPQTSPIEDILEHYFQANHIYVKRGRKITYIAWSEKLANINMRFFVNTP